MTDKATTPARLNSRRAVAHRDIWEKHLGGDGISTREHECHTRFTWFTRLRNQSRFLEPGGVGREQLTRNSIRSNFHPQRFAPETRRSFPHLRNIGPRAFGGTNEFLSLITPSGNAGCSRMLPPPGKARSSGPLVVIVHFSAMESCPTKNIYWIQGPQSGPGRPFSNPPFHLPVEGVRKTALKIANPRRALQTFTRPR